MSEHQEEIKIRSKYYKFTVYEKPKGEINLFARSGVRRNEVIIGGKDNEWDVYCEGYIRAAEVLVDWVIQDELQERSDYSVFWESIGYSIVFLYRHYFELRIKEMYLTCEGELSKINNEHSLDKLWDLFIDRYQNFGKEHNFFTEESLKQELEDVKPAEIIVKQLSEIDKRSEIFRYPVNRTGVTTLKEALQFDVVHLKHTLGWTSQLLDGWSNGIYECWQDDLRSKYENRIVP